MHTGQRDQRIPRIHEFHRQSAVHHLVSGVDMDGRRISTKLRLRVRFKLVDKGHVIHQELLPGISSDVEPRRSIIIIITNGWLRAVLRGHRAEYTAQWE